MRKLKGRNLQSWHFSILSMCRNTCVGKKVKRSGSCSSSSFYGLILLLVQCSCDFCWRVLRAWQKHRHYKVYWVGSSSRIKTFSLEEENCVIICFYPHLNFLRYVTNWQINTSLFLRPEAGENINPIKIQSNFGVFSRKRNMNAFQTIFSYHA